MILATHYIEPSSYLGGIDFTAAAQHTQSFEHAQSTSIGKYSHPKIMSNQVMSVSTSNSNDSSEAGSPPSNTTVKNENPARNTKRRASRAGTRSVSTLTTAQLARKRANDREAQRAIRQRTKEHIEGLERRIAELTSSDNPESKLDEALQRNASLERDLRQLRKQLEFGSAESLANKNSVMIEAASLPGQTPMERPSTGYSQTSLPGYDGHINMAMSQPNGGYSTPIATAFLNDRNEHPFSPLQSRADIRRHSSNSDVEVQRSWVVPSTLSQTSSPILSEPSNNSRSALRMNPLPQSIPGIRVPSTPLQSQQSRYPWELPIRFMPPTGPVDHLLIGLLQTRRSLAMGGANHESLIGPYQPSMKFLLYPEAVDPSSSGSLAGPISDLLVRTLMKTLPEKAACLFVMYHLLQWQISPLEPTYDALPDWHSPRASQLITPHPIWIDQIPWGKLRDKVINNQALYATEEFQQLYLANLNINWPYRPLDAFVFIGDDVHASPLFEKHLLKLENWSLGPGFAQRYPELANVCRFTAFSQEMEGAMCMAHLGGAPEQQQQHQVPYQI